jgi:replicative DNA helicase
MSDPRPYSLEAEWAIIGACLLDGTAMARVTVGPHDFHGMKTRLVWSVMRELHATHQDLDPIVIADKADRHQTGAVIASEIIDALNGVLTAANIEHWDAIVREHALTRSVLDVLGSGASDYRAGKKSGEELLRAVYERLAAIDTGRTGKASTIGEIVRERACQLDEIVQARARGEWRETGVTTGIPRLDAIMSGGWQPCLQLLVGRPAMGKSAALLAFADAATAAGIATHVVSLEDVRDAYADRTLARMTRLELTRLRTARLGGSELAAVRDAVVQLWERREWLYTDRRSMRGRTWADVVQAVRAARHEHDTQLVLVDYANIVHANRYYGKRGDALAEVVNGFADASDDDGIAYVVAAQLNRDCEKRPDKRPILADLRDSGTLEERAKAIIGLYRGAYYGDPVEGIDWRRSSSNPLDICPSSAEWESRLDMIVMKNNHGPEGLVRCHWDGPRARIVADARGMQI